MCGLITACLSSVTLHQDDTRKLLDRYLELASRRRETQCHEAVGQIYERLSQLQDCAKEVIKSFFSLRGHATTAELGADW